LHKYRAVPISGSGFCSAVSPKSSADLHRTALRDASARFSRTHLRLKRN
jgi:hypothetical protein